MRLDQFVDDQASMAIDAAETSALPCSSTV
jgi:hypothetical protein